MDPKRFPNSTLNPGLAIVILLALGMAARSAHPPATARAKTASVIQVCPSATCDYLTIQEAVDHATDGDVIQVLTIPAHTEAGIEVNKDLTI